MRVGLHNADRRLKNNQSHRKETVMKLTQRTLKSIQCAALLGLTLVAQPARAGDSVPFHATYETQFSVEVTPPLANVSATGTGLATHLGRMEVESIN